MFGYVSMIYIGFGIHGTGEDESKVGVLMNSCVRFVCNLSMRDHVSEKYVDLELLNERH